MDNQQFYKISDISHIVVIGNKSKGEHGITPPMYNAKHRFRKRVVKTQMVEGIENRVKELLERDKNCVGAELIFGEGEQKEESEDVSSLAAELEYNLIASEKNIVTEESDEIKQKKELLKELEEKIKTKEELLNTASNIILKKRFQESIFALKEEYNKVIGEIKNLENNEKD
ncbi:hypothetical protein LUQ84_002344 [Hamiltosporidium tvaerminnensis]|nr:hypothetical protein LUQ84_002344 [Hamiltosporidium tvaerminnensis]